ncbi:biotin--[acetyl-CoA-carboxylase] ligase [Actinomyces qiguomingii]|uniref:biotin--[acetyl-CoA-carboxylase] ligase n=1 Tax=Actinomyces qiguomingii TaxID=2057800 RepID=UPI000CA01DEC|nr:biotin--[acetyl-CoA-carboxylase] ligase [Actinomyces qiguomingii]
MSPSSPFNRLEVVERTGSTNTDLRRALSGPDGLLDPDAAASWPHMSALRAITQTAGRGRAEHAWTTPPAGALTASIVLRPLVPAKRLAWLPLLVGLAVSRALAPRLESVGWATATKWPNDVIAVPIPDTPAPEDLPGWGSGRKLAGILTELIAPAGFGSEAPQAEAGAGVGAACDRRRAAAVVVGIGVNLFQPAGDMPVPWAASLTSLGAPVNADDPAAVLNECGWQLARLLPVWERVCGDPDAGDGLLGAELRSSCATLGQTVRVTGADGELTGTAVDLNPSLVLEVHDDGPPHRAVVTAGDVVRVRAAGSGV